MTARQCFYRLDGGADFVPLAPGYAIERFNPSFFSLRPGTVAFGPSLAHYVSWYLLSDAPYCIYSVRHGGTIVHQSHVLARNPRFAFMTCGELEIGPCWTAEGHRGHGLYRSVLTHIARDHPERTLWMFAEDRNIGSRRGIERAGFAFTGYGSRRWGIYRLTHPATEAGQKS